jgi:hypothetical protein
LQENKEEANPDNSNNNSDNNSYMARTARVQHQDKQIEQLLNQGYTVEDVIYIPYGHSVIFQKLR